MTHDGFHWMIFFLFLKKASLDKIAQYCFVKLLLIEATSEMNVYDLFAEFRHSCFSVNDEFREERPKSVMIPNNIDAVCKMIEETRNATYHEI